MNIHGSAAPRLSSRFGIAATTAAIAITLLNPAFTLVPLAQANDETGSFDPSSVLQFPAPQTVEILAIDMTRIVGQQMRLIRYQASDYQRKVAEERARAFVAAQRRAAAAPKTTKPSKKGKPDEPKAAAKPKKLPRYLAVDTVKDKRASPKAKKVVMLWDTQSEALVGNDIYDVDSPPPVGSVAKFETLSAEYIGAGQ